MTNKLQQYFPMIRTKAEILGEIQSDENLRNMYNSWDSTARREFLDFCSGAKGVKILYDAFFKEVLNPETVPERVDDLLSVLLGRQVHILQVLPGDNSRIADESSLLIMDILVELEDGSLANVECQKMGYLFPGERSACYSADLLLRQYKRIKSQRKKQFSYRDIRRVYTIVFLEESTEIFRQYPEEIFQYFTQKSNTGLPLELLQEYLFIPLDVFHTILHNEGIKIDSKEKAWLTFLSEDSPEVIVKLIEAYPEFRAMYQDIYQLCRNTERVMGVFSEELRILDRNTVQLMIDELQDRNDELEEENARLRRLLGMKKQNGGGRCGE